ncbi:MAG: 3-hydroxyacyl-CoA dehydrogenase/enoyl-CoA hydratase/3-hydroxybutyryl-CoA epimerase [Myxococcota bacterium]|jgi:3-hydroxyacyl-CoA dehydrogenase/enoyl-CoA hydratase/3-hydroxybutyryl-CoA epimerase
MSELQGMTIAVDSDGIATLTIKMPGKVNKIGADFIATLGAALDQVFAIEGLTGIIVASGHRDFCAGADIDTLYHARDAAQIYAGTQVLNGLYRRLETGGVPVVAAITGAALGGGYELALACHRRIALNDARIMVGLPEASIGVIPGAGGTQRLPWIMGLQPALEILGAGGQKRVTSGIKSGMVDELADSVEALHEAAKAWIQANPDPKQPWDAGGKLPGGIQPGSREARNLFTGAAAFLYKKSAGVFPAAETILEVVHQGLSLKFDRALEFEGRAFAKLAVSDQVKDMVRTLWYHRTAVEKQEGLPRVEDAGISKVAVLGAGMMGAGLAYICAKSGYTVVLKDISQDALDAGVAHIDKQIGKMRHAPQETRDAIRGRITATLDYADIAGSDLAIEAVVEIIAVKHAVIREVEPLLAPGAIFASNTSAIPITRLAEASIAPERFIGMHFFSPVEKMPLLEIISPKATSEQTLARSLAFGRKIKKTCIVVNDGYGFYTSRLFGSYLLEGCQLVAEGHDPALIEWAARTAGMAMPPLKVFDEVSLRLGMKGFEVRKAVTGIETKLEGIKVVQQLVEEHGRLGRVVGKGFYDWDTKTLWPGLRDMITARPERTGLDHIQRRLMLIQAAEIGRILDDGILINYRDAEIGAVFGLGFAPNTGGPLAWIDAQGISALVGEMSEMATAYGDRYAPSASLMGMAERSERFFDAV